MIDSILVGGHEAEMAALEELERSEEMRLLSQQLAARDLCEAASELLDMVDGSWEPTENLFGEVPTIEQAIEQACERALDEVERCLHHLMSKECD